jgi:hypothetical protein
MTKPLDRLDAIAGGAELLDKPVSDIRRIQRPQFLINILFNFIFNVY